MSKGCGHCDPELCTECGGFDPTPSDEELRAEYEELLREEVMDGIPCEMCGCSAAVVYNMCKACIMETTGLTGEEVDSLIQQDRKQELDEFQHFVENYNQCEVCTSKRDDCHECHLRPGFFNKNR